MALTAEQILNRSKGVGGSECAMALGVSKFKTARELYHEKRGELESTFLDDSDVIWWGNALEPIVRQKYAETTGRIVRLPQETQFSAEHDFMLCHVDGVSEDQNGHDPRGYEGKTAFLSTGWGEEYTDQIPEDYLLQVHHNLIVTQLPAFDVMSLIDRRFRMYCVEPDKELHEMIIEGEREFMRRVREGDPPPLDYQHKTALDVVRKLYPGTNGVRLIANEDQTRWRELMQAAAAAESKAKAEKEGWKARLLESMSEAALLAFPDGKAFRRQETKRAAYTVDASVYVDSRFVNDPLATKGATRK